MRLKGERMRLGRDGGRSSLWRIVFYLALIVGGISLTRLVESGRVQPLFLASPTPTRTAFSYAEEGEAHFSSGNLSKAIEAYQTAASLEPENAVLWAELARIQTYSSDLLTTLDERRIRLGEARESIEHAVQVGEDNAKTHAVRALVYDWSAAAELKDSIGLEDEVKVMANLADGGRITARRIELSSGAEPGEEEDSTAGEATVLFTGVVEAISPDAWTVSGRTVEITPQTIILNPNRREEFLGEAETSATRARQLDPGNALALAFFAEVLVDQQRFAQALDLVQTAAETSESLNPQERMDVHRVYGTVLESHGLYLRAIEEYRKASQINPNLTFLYLRIGANFRRLGDVESALDNFDRAAKINQQLDFQDPTPYLAIGRTYVQEGEFFIAAANIERALAIDPGNAEIYARLGSVYFQARNYESAIPVLKCAIDGCSAAESGQLLCDLGVFACDDEGDMALQVGKGVPGMELGPSTVEYYYTYGSVLAAFAGVEAYPNACEDAERIFRALMAQYGSDPIVTAIVEEGRAICFSPSLPSEPISTPAVAPTESP
jgi:tetratricopeptide (TPR) repeat protein